MLGMANEERGYYFGIEGAYNQYLKGQNGQQLVRRIHHGDWIPVNSDDDTDAQNGDDVVTTFDIKLQDIVESALNNTLTTNKAEQGCAILMDVETGYVRALANLSLNHETGHYEESYTEEFARKNYKSYIFIDFNKAGDEIKELFDKDLNDLDSLFMLLFCFTCTDMLTFVMCHIAAFCYITINRIYNR